MQSEEKTVDPIGDIIGELDAMANEESKLEEKREETITKRDFMEELSDKASLVFGLFYVIFAKFY